MFDYFDKDGNGSITAEEFATALRGLGYNPTEREIREMIKKIDKDGTWTTIKICI